jgi:hypothetical protein
MRQLFLLSKNTRIYNLILKTRISTMTPPGPISVDVCTCSSVMLVLHNRSTRHGDLACHGFTNAYLHGY